MTRAMREKGWTMTTDGYALDQLDLICMLKGSTPSMEACVKLTEQRIMVFCGNQHNPDWKFVDAALLELGTEELYCLYQAIKFQDPNPGKFIEDANNESNGEN